MIKDINNKIILNNVLLTSVFRMISLFLNFVLTPIYISFFDNNVVLGLWYTILSVVNWILNFDLGIGNGLRNHLTKSIILNDGKQKYYISSAYYSLAIITIIGIVVSFSVFFINWSFVFNIKPQIVSLHSIRISVFISVVSIFLQMFLRVISAILYAKQHSALNSLVTLSSSIIILVSLETLTPGLNGYNLVLMSIVNLLATIIPLVMITFIYFYLPNNRNMVPQISCVKKEYCKDILVLGGQFFYLQIMYMLIMNTNSYLITFLCASEFAVDYQIYYSVFALGSTAFALILGPIWSVVTKAIAEKKYEWVEKTTRTLCYIALACSICEFLAIPFLDLIFDIWLKDTSYNSNISCALVFASFGSIMIIVSAVSNIANGLGELKTQMICYTIAFFIKIIFSIIWVNCCHSWIGIVLSNVIVLLPYCFIQYKVINNKLNDYLTINKKCKL